MAVVPRRTEVTRDQVQGWINGYKTRTQVFKDANSLESYLRDKIDKLQIEDRGVVTEGHDDLDDETDIADMILADLESYSQ